MSDPSAPDVAPPSTFTPPPRVPFEQLLMPLLDAAYGTALHLTRNRADAEDLVSDATLLAFRAYGSFQPGTNFKAWFFRILTNAFLSRWRRGGNERATQGLEDASEVYIYARARKLGMVTDGDDPAHATLGQMQAEEVAAALEALPDEFRLVATLYFMQDFSYQQIADMVGVPVGTVRSRLHRARKMLQKRLWQIAEDHGIVRRESVPAPEVKPR